MEDYTGRVAEPVMRLTQDMSEELLDSDLLGRIRGLSSMDKSCLIRYIREDLAENGEWVDNDDAWNEFEDDLPLLTLEEMRNRAVTGVDQYRKGECCTSKELHKMLEEEFEWLR